jgi:glutathione peroxidase-family protein
LEEFKNWRVHEIQESWRAKRTNLEDQNLMKSVANRWIPMQEELKEVLVEESLQKHNFPAHQHNQEAEEEEENIEEEEEEEYANKSPIAQRSHTHDEMHDKHQLPTTRHFLHNKGTQREREKPKKIQT